MASRRDDLDSALVRAARAHRTATGRRLSALGLHPGQDALLRLLWAEDGQRQTQLADALQVEPPTVTKMLQRMEVAGLVTRKGDKADGRVSLVKLTAKGKRLQPKVEAATADVTKEATRGVTAKDAAALVATLDKIAANLSAN
jgi:MarR family transcriptional regulator, organic hydroperoxide resistance regulator